MYLHHDHVICCHGNETCGELLIHITDRTEKNATGWSKSLLESMLVDLVMEGEEGELSCALYVMYCIYLVTMAP